MRSEVMLKVALACCALVSLLAWTWPALAGLILSAGNAAVAVLLGATLLKGAARDRRRRLRKALAAEFDRRYPGCKVVDFIPGTLNPANEDPDLDFFAAPELGGWIGVDMSEWRAKGLSGGSA